MISEYVQITLEKAKCKIIDDEEPYYGEIPELPGVWATAKTLEGCLEQLRSTVEDWLLLGLKLGHNIPPLGGIDLNVPIVTIVCGNYYTIR